MNREKNRDEAKSYLTRSEVARILQVSPTTVTRWAHEGRLPSQLTLGGHHRFERSVVEELRRSLQSGGESVTGAHPAAVAAAPTGKTR